MIKTGNLRHDELNELNEDTVLRRNGLIEFGIDADGARVLCSRRLG
jgi:hypothetical protein